MLRLPLMCRSLGCHRWAGSGQRQPLGRWANMRYLVFGGRDVVEGRVDASLEHTDAVGEVGEEERRLVALDFPVLHGDVLQVGVQLDRLVHRRPRLVL